MKIASRKKKSPSIANGIPKAPPKRPIRPGQRSPISNDRTVPVTAPTANVTAITVDQRRARRSAAGSLRRSPIALAIRTMVGQADPETGQDDVEAEGERHLRPSGEQVRRDVVDHRSESYCSV